MRQIATRLTARHREKKIEQHTNQHAKKMKRLSECMGIACMLCADICAIPADAVMLSFDGIGQALIYPYYTVHDSPSAPGTSYVTLVSVVNRTEHAKALRLRFHEARAGAAVFAANIFLSKNDVWVAAVIPVGESGAAIFTPDVSCTMTDSGLRVGDRPVNASSFSDSVFANDGLGADPARTREGYFEILEMGMVQAGTALEKAVTHRPEGPFLPTCALPDAASIPSQLAPPSGGLYGSATLINVTDGISYAVDAVALAQWSDAAQYTLPGDPIPSVASISPSTTTIIDAGRAYVSPWASAVDAVSALFMTSRLDGEFLAELGIAGNTDVVITMPTKPLLVDLAYAQPPFSATGGRCESTYVLEFSREEQKFDAIQEAHNFELPWQYTSLCAASTVFGPTTAGRSSALGASEVAHPAPRSRFGDGIWRLHFLEFPLPPVPSIAARRLVAQGATTVIDSSTGNVTTQDNVAYLGLPVIATSFTRYSNGTLTDAAGTHVLSNYGTNSAFRPTRMIVVP